MIPTARVLSTHQGLLGSLSCTRVLIELASNGGSGEKCRRISEILIFLLDSLLNKRAPKHARCLCAAAPLLVQLGFNSQPRLMPPKGRLVFFIGD